MHYEQQQKINSQFIDSVRHQDLDLMKKLLAQGAENQTTQYYALTVAAQTNNKAIVEYLIEYKHYSLETGLEGALTISIASLIEKNTLDTAVYLQSKGAKLNLIQGKYALVGAVDRSDEATMHSFSSTVDYVLKMCGKEIFKSHEIACRAAKKEYVGPAQYLIENYGNLGLDIDLMLERGSDNFKNFINIYREKQALDGAVFAKDCAALGGTNFKL